MPKGHSKGSEFERKIAKEIIKAFRKAGWRHLDQNDCWRSVMSGGHDMSYGDLRLSPEMLQLFPFAIECKHRRKIHLENIFMGEMVEERKWITQACEGTKGKHFLTPVLVMRGNFGRILALVGPLSEVQDNDRAEIYFQEANGPWQMMLWSQFLKRAVNQAKKNKKAA
jgi:hypothetical protein